MEKCSQWFLSRARDNYDCTCNAWSHLARFDKMDIWTSWLFGPLLFLNIARWRFFAKKIEALFKVSLWWLTLKVNCVHHKIWNISKWALKAMLLPDVWSLDNESSIIREFRAVPKWLLSLSTSFRLHLNCSCRWELVEIDKSHFGTALNSLIILLWPSKEQTPGPRAW